MFLTRLQALLTGFDCFASKEDFDWFSSVV